MAKTPPNFLFPTNFRNGKSIKRLIKDFNVQGYGIAVFLLETLSETEQHQYPICDIDLLADEMKVSIAVINTVISSYGIFEIIEHEDGSKFISPALNQWLVPYYEKIENLSRAGKISALRKKQKQEEQIKQLSLLDSTQHKLNTSTTINELINKKRKKDDKYKGINSFIGKKLEHELNIYEIKNIEFEVDNFLVITNELKMKVAYSQVEEFKKSLR